MIVSEHEQGTDGWLKDRLGIPTASNFSKIITGQGKPSASAKSYMHQLLAESLTGEYDEGYTSDAMEHGNLT